MRKQRFGALLAAGVMVFAGAGTALLATPGVASAHTPNVTFTCEQSGPVLDINLTAYNSGVTNTVAATIDGGTVLATTTFGSSYSHSFPGGSPFVGHSAQVVVIAGDDPDGTHGWTKTFNPSVPACQTETTTTSSETTSSETTSSETTTTETTTETTSSETTSEETTSSETTSSDTTSSEPVIPSLETACGGTVTVGGLPEGWHLVVEPGDNFFGNGTFDLAPADYTWNLRNAEQVDQNGEGQSGTFTIAACTTSSTTSSDTTTSQTTSNETSSTSTSTSTTSKSEPTPPSTDTISTGGSSSGGISPLLLIIFAGFLGGALLVAPGKARNRR